jgi:hypothetical protein
LGGEIMQYCSARAAQELGGQKRQNGAVMGSVANEQPFQRWQAIEKTLGSRGFLTLRVLRMCERRSGPADQTPCGLVALRRVHARSVQTAAALEAVFSEYGMAVVDLAASGDDLTSDFCVWLHPRERLLEQPAWTAERAVQRLAAVTRHLEARGVVVSGREVRETAYGPRGRLVLQTFDAGFATNYGVIVLVLGPWGWTSWDHDQWRESPAPAGTEDADDLNIVDYVWGVARAYRELATTLRAAPPWEEVIGAAAVTSVVVPFVQAFAAKAADDCYQALRDLISRHTQTGKRTSLQDQDAKAELIFDPPLPDEAIKKLAQIKPTHLEGKVARWDAQNERWEISPKRPSKF